MSTIGFHRYGPESETIDDFLEVEVNESEVDIITTPRREEAATLTFTVEETWRLIRDLSRAVVQAEGNED